MARENKAILIIEIVISVIVVAILVVTVIPRYFIQISQSRILLMNRIASEIKNDVGTTVTQYRSTKNNTHNTVGTAYTNIQLNGTTVSVNAGTGYPAATFSGIGQMIPAITGIKMTYTPPTVTYNFFLDINNCFVTYNEKTGQVVTTTSGC
jgi:hypothetical protein